MSYPITVREVREMIMDIALETKTARDIARKSGIRSGSQLAGVRMANSMGIFSWLHSTDTDYGYVGAHDAGLELPFPRDVPTIYPHDELITVRQSGWQGFVEGRLVANVTNAGTAGSSLFISVDDGEEVRGFTNEPPSIPLDEVGFHVSPWRLFAWDPIEEGLRLMRTRFLIDNPGGASGSFYVGFCQFQAR